MKVNVDLTGLEEARSAITRLEEYAADGFDHASDVTTEITKGETAFEVFRDAFRAALDAANV